MFNLRITEQAYKRLTCGVNPLSLISDEENPGCRQRLLDGETIEITLNKRMEHILLKYDAARNEIVFYTRG